MWQCAIDYLDLIAILCNAAKHQINYRRWVLCIFKEDRLTTKLKEFSFATNRIDYVDRVIKSGKLTVANHTADAIRNAEVPITLT